MGGKLAISKWKPQRERERERERERDQHAHVSYPCKNFITITSDWQADAESCYGNKIILYAVWEMSF